MRIGDIIINLKIVEGEIMSKLEQITTKKSNDDFGVFQKSSSKYFADVEHSAPQYHKVISELQDEYLQTWKNVINANISIQKEFVIKAGLNTNLPDISRKIVDDMTEEIIKARTVQDKIAIATIEGTTKNIKTWNDNANIFADLNRNIMEFWMSAFTPIQKD